MDIFGIKKEAESAPEPEAPTPKRTHQKLWAFLLVLDAIFVIVFGGALAAKVYQHWASPSVLVPPQAHRRPIKQQPPAAKPAEPAAAQPVAAKPAEPPKPPEKPQAVEAPKNQIKAAKPWVLAEPPKSREAPKLRTANKEVEAVKPAEAPRAAGEKPKAVAVDFKLTAPRARNVRLAGAFIVRGGHKEMSRVGDSWALTLHLLPATNYRYWFIVDGKKMLDPENSKVERGASVLSLP